MKTFVVGHKNPDTDSVVAAIAFAELENNLGKDYAPAVAGKVNKETSYVLARFGVAVPEVLPGGEKKVVIVDVNEPSQLAENIKVEEIVGILDHHKLGGLATAEPILVKIEPVGSTSTIVARMYHAGGIDIPDKTARILLAGILSDTLNFNSPTTTEEDKKIAGLLNETAGLDMDELAQEMFKAKSDLTGISSEDLVEADYKVFDIGGKKVGIGVFETVDPAPALARREEIAGILNQKKTADGLNNLFLAVIDIFQKAAYFITPAVDDRELIASSFAADDKEGVLYAAGIVSRKKQIVPAIEKTL